MKLYKITLSFLFLLVFFSACRKDDLVIDEQPIPNPTVKFEINTTGEVYDLQGEPIKNAIVTLGDNITQTDDNGFFDVTGLANESKAVVSVEKEGYYSGHPVFYPEEGTGQHVKVQLMERLVSGTVTTSDRVVNVDQHQVDFTNATFKDVSGNPYTGNVTVFATYLDPTDDNLQQYMPGDLVGVNTDNEEQLLKSYGMLNVELEDDMGNPINIDGEAEMTMEVPIELIGQAPTTIPLWYFDEPSGNWIEEGEATLVGNQYVGTVTHFTLWNCDAPFDLVNIYGTVNTSLDPSAFHIRVTRPNGDDNTTPLNEGGRFQGKVPANEVLTLEVIDFCGNALVSESIGPLSVETNVGTFDLSGISTTTITVSGTAIDCDLNPITNGYAMVSTGNGYTEFLNLDNDGAFSGTLVWCAGTDIHVTAFDTDEFKKSETATFAFNSNITSNNMVTCEDNVAGIFISGPDINKFIPATNNFESIDPSLQAFQFVCLDDQGNGNKLLYTITVLDWTGNPSNPSIAHSYDLSAIGDPDVTTWDSTDPIVNAFSITSGELIDFEYENITITITDPQNNFIEYPNHNLRIVGFVD